MAARSALSKAANRLFSSRNLVERELLDRARTLLPFGGHVPQVAVDAFVAPNATLVGDVFVKDRASIFSGAVLRGDKAGIRVGFCSNVQDRAVISTVSCVSASLPLTIFD